MPTIHPTAIIDPRAELADDVEVGAFTTIGAGVTVGAGTVLFSHNVIQGPTVIGAGCKIGPAAYVGLDPQHLEFLTRPDPPKTWLTIGDRAIIREGVTVHRATKSGRENATTIGDDCMLMGASHVAHDCRLGSRVIMANGALLGGHCQIGDRAFMGGGCTIHQFARIGRLAIVAGNEACSRDIPPFAAARYGGLKGYNAIGCRRAGLSREGIHAIRSAFYCIHSNRTTSGIVAAIKATCPQTPEVIEMLEFIAGSRRGIHPSLKFANYLHTIVEEAD
jgi:UDP-N-acetylglucosamine acyltransferase